MDFFQPLVSFDSPSGVERNKWLLGVVKTLGCKSYNTLLGFFNCLCCFSNEVAGMSCFLSGDS